MKRREHTSITEEMSKMTGALEAVQATVATGQKLVLDSIHDTAAEVAEAKAEIASLREEVATLKGLLETAAAAPQVASAAATAGAEEFAELVTKPPAARTRTPRAKVATARKTPTPRAKTSAKTASEG